MTPVQVSSVGVPRILSRKKSSRSQPPQNQVVVGSLSRLLEIFDHLLSRTLLTFSCILQSLSLLLPTNNDPHLFVFAMIMLWVVKTLPENTKYLVNFRISMEQWSLGDHLSKNTSQAPDVQGASVTGSAQQDFRGSVPQCDDLRQGKT